MCFQDLNADGFAAVVIPGGFGAAKNLCTFGVSDDPTVDDDVARVLRQFRDQKKPIGLCCISPIIAAMVFAAKDSVSVSLCKEWRFIGETSEMVLMQDETRPSKTEARLQKN